MDLSEFEALTGKPAIRFIPPKSKPKPQSNPQQAVDLYRTVISMPSSSKKPAKKKIKIEEKVRFKCSVCNKDIEGTGTLSNLKVQHYASMAHQLSKNNSLEEPVTSKRLVHYPESTKNTIGFKMLQQEGWSVGEGLGSNGSGRLLPIATVFKQDRSGLGLKKEKKRITHDPIIETIEKPSFDEYLEKQEKDRKDRMTLLAYLNRD